MFGLFALLTFKITFLGILSFIGIEAYIIIVQRNIMQALINLLINIVYFFIVYSIIYLTLPAFSLANTTYKKIPGYFIVDATNKNASTKFVKKDMYMC